MNDPASDRRIEQDAGVFVELVTRYFQLTGGSPPELLPPSLEWVLPARLDSTGYMPVAGAFEGWIAVSMPDAMLRSLLREMGETSLDDASLLDLTAEMTSVITSNARAHFGERLQVVPPLATRHGPPPSELPTPDVSFKLPFRWKGDEGFLLVALRN